MSPQAADPPAVGEEQALGIPGGDGRTLLPAAAPPRPPSSPVPPVVILSHDEVDEEYSELIRSER